MCSICSDAWANRKEKEYNVMLAAHLAIASLLFYNLISITPFFLTPHSLYYFLFSVLRAYIFSTPGVDWTRCVETRPVRHVSYQWRGLFASSLIHPFLTPCHSHFSFFTSFSLHLSSSNPHFSIHSFNSRLHIFPHIFKFFPHFLSFYHALLYECFVM